MTKFYCKKKNCTFSTDHKFLLANHRIKKLCCFANKQSVFDKIDLLQNP
jgi:hypothetical protein